MGYALGAVKPWVKAAAEEVGPKYGVTTIYGYRPGRGVYGQSDHPLGLALDFMVYRNKARGDNVANYFFVNQQRLSVHYIIWYRKIWNVKRASEGWRDYHGTSNPHTDHVHVSFLNPPNAGTGSGGGSGGGIPTVSDLDNIVKAAEWLTNEQNWIRIGTFLAGAVLLIIGTLRLISSSVGLSTVTSVASKAIPKKVGK